MCGIAGGMAFTEQGRLYLNNMAPALETLRLRGPDQSGIFSHGNVSIGQTRLSVIDVTEAASQPFTDDSGRFTLVFNGEIYNFVELRKSLIQKGINFRSNSDTEVLLYLYMLEGPSFLEKLNGFFAFCIFDKSENSFFIARDRMGIKPLFFYSDETVFLFASELKALIKLGIPKVIDRASLFSYLQLNYIPAPASIFGNVVKAEPGTYSLVSKGRVLTEKFYQIPYIAVHDNHDDYETACKKIRELMDLSVQRRMVADVPLGAFLSGGIDSSIITGLAARHTEKLSTFSIGFTDEPLFDETRYAEEIARLHRTDHHSFRLSTDDLFEVLPKVLDYIDEPFADSSALAVYILSRETRKHVTVALSGDGADELYGGYNKHAAECRMRTPGLSEKLVHLGRPLWKVLPKSRNSRIGNRIRQFDRFASGMSLSAAERYWRWASFIDETEANSMLAEIFSENKLYADRKNAYIYGISDKGDLNDVLYADMHLVLRNDMLVKVDMMSMANSLEVRVPFLDHEHVGYVFSLPWFYKAGKDCRKKILKDAFREMLPEVILRRGKHGFEVPLLKWFRTELKPMIHQELLEEEFVRHQGIFDPGTIKQLLNRLGSRNPGDTAARVWGLIVFQHWWKKYMK